MFINTMLESLKKSFWWLPISAVPATSCQSLKEQISKPKTFPHLIDVRTPEEWSRGHIKGSINIPVNLLKVQIPQLTFDPGRPVVLVCAAGVRSRLGVRYLRSRGFENTSELSGGMAEWARLGMPVAG